MFLELDERKQRHPSSLVTMKDWPAINVVSAADSVLTVVNSLEKCV